MTKFLNSITIKTTDFLIKKVKNEHLETILNKSKCLLSEQFESKMFICLV